MINQEEFAAIAALDLDPIKVKLMHEASGEGWSLDKANAVEAEYRRFLFLMKKFPEEQTAPLFDVDIFWHYHILDTMKYAQDCEQVFGYFLHHFPYIGLRGEDDEAAHRRVGQRMQELYEETFGEPYLRGQAAWSGAAQAQSAWSGIAAKTAWSGVAAKTAWSGVAAKTAWSGAAKDAKLAWSGAANAQTAWSGIPSTDPFYSVRPTLARAAA
ncbi:MAG TPA: glycine-rich domain-containing protein-like [Telluria sp.]|nr:glycine-rich domain-containing protein-like [Telluria sp.]